MLPIYSSPSLYVCLGPPWPRYRTLYLALRFAQAHLSSQPKSLWTAFLPYISSHPLRMMKIILKYISVKKKNCWRKKKKERKKELLEEFKYGFPELLGTTRSYLLGHFWKRLQLHWEGNDKSKDVNQWNMAKSNKKLFSNLAFREPMHLFLCGSRSVSH